MHLPVPITYIDIIVIKFCNFFVTWKRGETKHMQKKLGKKCKGCMCGEKLMYFTITN